MGAGSHELLGKLDELAPDCADPAGELLESIKRDPSWAEDELIRFILGRDPETMSEGEHIEAAARTAFLVDWFQKLLKIAVHNGISSAFGAATDFDPYPATGFPSPSRPIRGANSTSYRAKALRTRL